MHYSLTRATAWNLAGYIYLILASFISTPILIHSLGLPEFSRYSLILASTILVSSINLGLPQAVTRALAKDFKFSPRRQTIWATSSLLFVITGVVAGLLAAIITSFLHVSLPILLLIFAICVMNNLVTHYATLSQSEGHFGYFNAKTFIVGTGNTLLAAYVAWRGQGITQILSAQLFTYLFALLPLAYFSLKFFPHPRDGVASKSVAKALITFGVKNQVGTIVGQIQAQYAKYLLATLSPILLSAYLIAQGLVQKLSGGVGQIASALYPASSRSNQSKAIRPIYYRTQLSLLALGLLGIGAYSLIGYSFLNWWLHSPELVKVVDSIMKIFVWYLAILVLTPLPSTILDGAGRPELTSMFATITTSIEIGLALILLPHYGLFAPVYSALIAVAFTTPAILVVTDRVLQSKL